MMNLDGVEMSGAEEAEESGELGIFLMKLSEEVGVVEVEGCKLLFFCDW